MDETVGKSTIDRGTAEKPPVRTIGDESVLGSRRAKKGYGAVALAALFWSYFRSALAILIAIPTAIILARLLTPSEFGIAAAARFFAQLAAHLSSGGMGAAIVRAKLLREEHVSSVFVFNAVLSGMAFVAILLASSSIGRFYDSPEVARVMPFAALNFLVVGLFTVPQALLGRDLRYKEMSAAGTSDLVVASAGACILAWAGFSYWSLVISDVVGALVKGGMTSYYTKWRPGFRFSRAAFRDLMSFGFGSYAARILHYAALNLDNMVVGRFLGMAALGFYDKGFSVGNKLFQKLSMAGPVVSFRIFSIIQEDHERFRRAYRKVLLSSTLIGYPFFAGLIAVAEPLFIAAFGERWRPSVLPFQILCVVFMLKLTNQYAGAATQAYGRIWAQVVRQMCTVTLIPVAVYLLSPWGLPGAAAGVLFATFVSWLASQQLLRTTAKLAWRDILSPQVPAVVCSIGLILVLAPVKLLLLRVQPDVPAWVLLLTQTCCGAAYYCTFIWFARFEEVRTVVDEAIANLRPKLARFVRPAASA